MQQIGTCDRIFFREVCLLHFEGMRTVTWDSKNNSERLYYSLTVHKLNSNIQNVLYSSGEKWYLKSVLGMGLGGAKRAFSPHIYLEPLQKYPADY